MKKELTMRDRIHYCDPVHHNDEVRDRYENVTTKVVIEGDEWAMKNLERILRDSCDCTWELK